MTTANHKGWLGYMSNLSLKMSPIAPFLSCSEEFDALIGPDHDPAVHRLTITGPGCGGKGGPAEQTRTIWRSAVASLPPCSSTQLSQGGHEHFIIGRVDAAVVCCIYVVAAASQPGRHPNQAQSSQVHMLGCALQ